MSWHEGGDQMGAPTRHKGERANCPAPECGDTQTEAREWLERGYDNLAPPARERYDLLDLVHQDEVWVDREGVEHRIADMEPRYCRNVINFLKRRADRIATAVGVRMITGPQPSGEVANDVFDAALDELEADPAGWLESTPLLEALARRAAEG